MRYIMLNRIKHKIIKYLLLLDAFLRHGFMIEKMPKLEKLFHGFQVIPEIDFYVFNYHVKGNKSSMCVGRYISNFKRIRE